MLGLVAPTRSNTDHGQPRRTWSPRYCPRWQTIPLTSGALGITDDISIGGPARFGTLVLSPAGALGVRIDANADGDGNAATSGGGNRRAFEITSGADATLDSLLITSGELLQRLLELVPSQQQPWLYDRLLVVASPR
jgi:hypothetical protein